VKIFRTELTKEKFCDRVLLVKIKKLDEGVYAKCAGIDAFFYWKNIR